MRHLRSGKQLAYIGGSREFLAADFRVLVDMTANPGELRSNPLQLSFHPFAVNGLAWVVRRSRGIAHFKMKLAQTG